jgi:hypothetical protein
MLHSSYVDVGALPGFVTLLLLLHEDDLFFAHRGVNVREVFHRVSAFVRGRDQLRGGSSITQQLAKHIFNSQRRRRVLTRWLEKLKELVIAKKLERSFSKRELLSLYLSSVRFGFYPAFGIKQAAAAYFGKTAEHIDLREALFFFGLISRPRALARAVCIRGKVEAYPFTNAFVKCIDLFRLLAKSYGWRILDNIGDLSYRDVECLACEMEWYEPKGFPPQLELALEQRALIEIAELKEVLVNVASRADEIFPEHEWSEAEQR